MTDPTLHDAALWCDEYELTMAQSFWRHSQHELKSCFELFVRNLPDNRGYLVAAGIDPVIEFLAGLRFSDSDCAFLIEQGVLDPQFVEHLRGIRFTGDVNAVTEGSVITAGVPLLQVIARRDEATLIESAVLAIVNHQTAIATKAARIVDSADGRPVWDFSMRRLHGLGPAIGVARAAYIAGCAGTATVAAGKALGIPTTGTMAHHYVLSFGEEREGQAFEQFLSDFPSRALVLVDTYDTHRGTERAIAASRATGIPLNGIRIDSGHLPTAARDSRALLDHAGMHDVAIVASGDLDEFRIAALLAEDAPINSFGVGTMLGTSADAPALGGVYKLVAQEAEGTMVGVMKRSPAKATDPGVHQVWRDAGGFTLGLAGEEADGVPLLEPVISGGHTVRDPIALETLRGRCVKNWTNLPAPVRRFRDPELLPLRRSDALQELIRTNAGEGTFA